MTYAIAVLDIGKTNKKLCIFDETLQLVDSAVKSIPPVERGHVRVEDVDALLEWFYEELRRFAVQYPVRAIGCSAHGAAFVGVDNDGTQSVPLVDYTFEPDESLHAEFFAMAGDRVELQQTTATVELKPLINPAKLLYFTKQQYPDEFEKCSWFLPYPSFIGMQLTGKPNAEWTYVGCHTYLWDFQDGRWSSIADALGIRSKLPTSVGKPWDVLGTVRAEIADRCGLDPQTVVTAGIHDSNAALVPYLLNQEEEFVLNSTGTWCVIMQPGETVRFEPDELGKSVFFNLSAFGKPVKTAVLMAGAEYDVYTGIFSAMHSNAPMPPFDPEVYRDVVYARSKFILPGVVVGAGQFPDSTARVVDGDEIYTLEEIRSGDRVPAFFHDLPTAYAVLNLSIAVQSMVAFDRVGVDRVRHVYTEGGFRKNADYNHLMASIFPDLDVFRTSMDEASAVGAAACAFIAYEQCSPGDAASLLRIDRDPVSGVDIPGLRDYADALVEKI
ncbi:MAG: FGGY-family carbohydrate kinase [Spirochaetaceae bacterium]